MIQQFAIATVYQWALKVYWSPDGREWSERLLALDIIMAIEKRKLK